MLLGCAVSLMWFEFLDAICQGLQLYIDGAQHRGVAALSRFKWGRPTVELG
jgi:hypothetical protein